MDLVLFGIQGSGKGTQAKKLAADLGYDIFEAGAELRAIATSDSALGRTVKSYIDAGNLVPHEIIMQVVQEAIATRSSETQILFDGIPRDDEQKKDFDTIMNKAGREFRGIQILLDADEAMARIVQRAQEQGRADDADTEVVSNRMRTFREKTAPVIASYKAEGKLTEVDGTGSVEEIYKRLCAAL